MRLLNSIIKIISFSFMLSLVTSFSQVDSNYVCRRQRDALIDPLGVLNPQQYDRVATRSISLRWLMEDNGAKQMAGNLITTPDIKPVLEANPELSSVIMGLTPAAILNNKLSEEQIAHLRYNLNALKIMQGVSIRLLQFSEGTIYAYDENALRSMLYQKENGFTDKDRTLGSTQLGLELIIKRDVLSNNGFFYSISQNALDVVQVKAMGQMMGEIFNGADISLQQELQVPYIVMCTYMRPTAMDRALSFQTENMALFGHKESITFVIIDNSPVGTPEQVQNVNTVQKYQRQGFNIAYFSRDDLLNVVHELAVALAAKYNREGISDPAIKELIYDQHRQMVQVDKLERLLGAMFSAQNIAAARTFSVLVTGGKMMNIDDDALPSAAIPTQDDLDMISQMRTEALSAAKSGMYAELSAIDGIDIREDSDFDNLLANFSQLNSDIQIVVERVLEKYYMYSADGATGLIPQAVGQIMPNADITPELEDRLRFARLFSEEYEHQGVTHLVTSEDTLLKNIEKSSGRLNLENYSFVPIDYVSVFNETLGAVVGDPEAGRIFTHDLRGGAGIPDVTLENLGRSISLVAGHFNNARDISGEALMEEALNYWIDGWYPGMPIGPGIKINNKADIADLQQVVRQALHLEVGGSTSTAFDRTNQYCFNLTSMDIAFPLPTIGGWLRIEEPIYKQLVEFITGETMAWGRVVGGHRRIPAEMRPRVDRQVLWEEMAMILWPRLDEVFQEFDGLPDGTVDPAEFEERCMNLGRKYLELAGSLDPYNPNVFTLNDGDKDLLSATRQRMVYLANGFLQLAALWESSPFNKGVQPELRELSDRLVHQFKLSKFMLEVDREGVEVIFHRMDSTGEYNWKSGKENFALTNTDVGRVYLNDIQPREVIDSLTQESNTVYVLNIAGEELILDHMPQAGEKVTFYVATGGDNEDRFFETVENYIRQQLDYDGAMLLLWPEIIKVARSLGYSPQWP